MVSVDVIMKFDPAIVGIYCKMITLSSGKSLNLDWIVKKIGAGREKVRKAIIFLEEKGYISRYPIRDEKGHISGWNYLVFPEPIKEKDRTHIGRKDCENAQREAQPTQNPTYGKPTTLETPTHIIIDNTISNNNNKEIIKEKSIKEFVPDGTSHPISDKELEYIEKMKKKFPRIMKLEQPLTLEQAKKLKEKYDRDLLAKVMLDLENYKPLLKKYVSAYYVINKWCQMELDRA